MACNVLVIIWLSKGTCHWFPSRFETSVQQSILLNFQGCQQDDQVCIKNQSAEYIFNQETEVFSSSFLFFLSLFFFWLNVFRWLSQGQEVESVATVRKVNCCLKWSKFQVAQFRSEQLCQLNSVTCLAYSISFQLTGVGDQTLALWCLDLAYRMKCWLESSCNVAKGPSGQLTWLRRSRDWDLK